MTEFRWKNDDDNSGSFKFEVELYNESESDKMLKELVWSYRRLYLPDVGGKSAEDFNQISKEHKIAWSSLNAAFGHHQELKSLCDRQGQDEALVETLQQWKNELIWPFDHKEGKWSDLMDKPEACAKMTEKLMQNQFWPFVKVIRYGTLFVRRNIERNTDHLSRIYLRSPILETGLILVDLPGITGRRFDPSSTNLSVFRPARCQLGQSSSN